MSFLFRRADWDSPKKSKKGSSSESAISEKQWKHFVQTIVAEFPEEFVRRHLLTVHDQSTSAADQCKQLISALTELTQQYHALKSFHQSHQLSAAARVQQKRTLHQQQSSSEKKRVSFEPSASPSASTMNCVDCGDEASLFRKLAKCSGCMSAVCKSCSVRICKSCLHDWAEIKASSTSMASSTNASITTSSETSSSVAPSSQPLSSSSSVGPVVHSNGPAVPVGLLQPSSSSALMSGPVVATNGPSLPPHLLSSALPSANLLPAGPAVASSSSSSYGPPVTMSAMGPPTSVFTLASSFSSSISSSSSISNSNNTFAIPTSNLFAELQQRRDQLKPTVAEKHEPSVEQPPVRGFFAELKSTISQMPSPSSNAVRVSKLVNHNNNNKMSNNKSSMSTPVRDDEGDDDDDESEKNARPHKKRNTKSPSSSPSTSIMSQLKSSLVARRQSLVCPSTSPRRRPSKNNNNSNSSNNNSSSNNHRTGLGKVSSAAAAGEGANVKTMAKSRSSGSLPLVPVSECDEENQPHRANQTDEDAREAALLAIKYPHMRGLAQHLRAKQQQQQQQTNGVTSKQAPWNASSGAAAKMAMMSSPQRDDSEWNV